MFDDKLPPPLVPIDVDLADFAFMPVDVQRLLKSDTWLAAIDNKLIAWACINLWFEAWHQKPASSLPGNDRLLARIAQVEIDDFMTIKETVMHGWTFCADGRYYHKVVAEKALEAWIEKLIHRFRGNTGNFRRHKAVFDAIGLNSQIEDAKIILKTINPNSKFLKKRSASIDDALALQLEMYPDLAQKLKADSIAQGLAQGLAQGVAEGDSSKNPENSHQNGAIKVETVAQGLAQGVAEGVAQGVLMRSQGTETETGTETEIKNKNTSGEASSPQEASLSSPAKPFSLESSQSALDLGVDKVLYRLIAAGGKTYYEVTQSYFDSKREFFPGVDLDSEFRLMASWCQDNASQRKTVQGMPSFINRWLSKQQNSLKGGPGATRQRGSQLSSGKWDGIDKKDFKGDVRSDYRF